jgi:hypothetical protein
VGGQPGPKVTVICLNPSDRRRLVAVLRGALDLPLGQDVNLLLAVRIVREEVSDPVQQALLLCEHIRSLNIQDGGFKLRPGHCDRHRCAAVRHLDRAALQLGEVYERDICAVADEQRLAAFDERRKPR